MVRTAVRQEVHMEEGHFMKKVFGTLAFLSFFYILGVVGAVEQDTMALGAGMVRMGIGLGCFWLFCELSGAVKGVKI